MNETILLSNGAGDRATINTFGAELMSWSAGGVDLVWPRNPKIWDQSAPILFPVVGWTRDGKARVGGKDFPLSLHGFAWKKQFSTGEQALDFLRLELEADDETRSLYPFSFQLAVEFRLLPRGLENALVVTNKGPAPLPYACGLHPAFNWPLDGSVVPHSIVFDQPERGEVPVIAPGGLFSSRTRPVPMRGDRLPLSQELLKDEALCFLNANSRSLAFDNGAGSRLTAELEDFPHIAFWSLPPAEYLCIEAWTGHGDPEDFFGELAEKPSMRLLAPGKSSRHAAIFRFERTGAFT
jgi:galactose mutarotase-like enzyme